MMSANVVTSPGTISDNQKKAIAVISCSLVLTPLVRTASLTNNMKIRHKNIKGKHFYSQKRWDICCFVFIYHVSSLGRENV